MSKDTGRVRTHYDNLKVMREAPIEVIRAAYKTLTQKYHPDRNPGDAEAARIMLLLNASYKVLSNPVKRRAHDEWITASERKQPEPASTSDWGPRPQPPSPPPPKPVNRDMSTGSRVAWVIGIVVALWWGSIALNNSSVSKAAKPYVSEAPRQTDPPSPADSVQASAPINQPSVDVDEAGFCVPVNYTFLESTPANKRQQVQGTVYKCKDGNGDIHFASQLQSGMRLREKNDAATNSDSLPIASIVPVSAHATGYEESAPKLRTQGHSKVLVDNSGSNADVLVKLVATDEQTAFPVRVFHVRKGEKFTASDVSPGTYEVRYRNMMEDAAWKSREFQLEEHPTDDGIEFSNYSLTLYQVPNGNMRPIALASGDF